MRDLADGPARGLHWRPEEAARALGFFPAVLSVTAGEAAGRPFHPLQWHAFMIGSLYGWRRADGLRRFRTGWMETGKGQAKSPVMGGIGIYEMAFCQVPRAEIYAIAGDKDQANVLFQDAVAMCRADIPQHDPGDTLESRGAVVIRGTGSMSWKIEHPESGSFFQAVASTDAISGPRPRVVLADEIHEMKSAAPIELWAQAIAKMPGDPLFLLGTNTPAADQVVGTEYSEYYQQVAKGLFHDDTSFVYIARTDPSDKPLDDETCWPKSLPALGVTFPVANIRGEVEKSRRMASKRLAVLRLYFGVPVGSASHWIDEDAWDACLGDVTDDDIEGLPLWLGLDLSQRNDLTALGKVWKRPRDGHLFMRASYFKPADTVAAAVASDKAPYDQWVASGHLTAVPGKTIGKDFVVAEVKRDVARYDVQELAFDPAHILDFQQEAAAAGFAVWEWEGPDKPAGSGLKMVRHAQGARGMHSDRMLWMPRSVQAFEDAVLQGRVTIDRNPITTWCSSNATLVADGQGNRYFDKRRSRGRIDGMVAGAMAIGAAEAGFAPAALSIWDRPEMAGVLW